MCVLPTLPTSFLGRRVARGSKNLKAKLEQDTPSPTNLDSQNMETGPSAITDSSNPINLEGICREINLLTSVRNQQKILDNKERERSE